MERVVSNLRNIQNRESTKSNYLTVWRIFNKFLIRLDSKPPTWEDRLTLFVGYMVDRGNQSSTIKSYISAIKAILRMDGYVMNEDMLLLKSLTRACKLKNDVVHTRLPIQIGLLELILFEVARHFNKKGQVYLKILYQSLFALAYYGMFRVGELTESQHTVKAKNIHVGVNKSKILIILYSSKTHGRDAIPQRVKITAEDGSNNPKNKRNFCPFTLVQNYYKLRGGYDSDEENFYVFRDKSPVKPVDMRSVLRLMLSKLNLQDSLYDCHSCRIGRTTDLARWNYPISKLKTMGRWTSNIVYKYIRDV